MRPPPSTSERRRPSSVWLSLFCVLLAVSAAQGHGGRTALAYPAEGIVVDGDLSDWPPDLPRYRVVLPEFGVAPEDSLDLTAHYRVAHDPAAGALYVAVEIIDQSIVIDRSPRAEWDTQDGCDIYVSLAHAPGSGTVMQYGLYGERLMYGNASYADWRYLHGDGWRTYEWRIDLGAMAAAGQAPAPGASLGFDVVVEDKDEDRSYSWMAWSPGTNKHTGGDRLGDVILLAGPEARGRIEGRLFWEDNGEAVAHDDIRLQSLERPATWTIAKTSPEGTFAVELPVGRYQILRPQAAAGETLTVAIAAGEVTALSVPERPVAGTTRAAGAGRTVAATGGLRHGAWQYYGSVDGLPHSQLFALEQDGEGRLWMGRNGLSRYDGSTFTHFTVDDGLPNDIVWSLAFDGEVLWIGTEGGLVRYDGEHFTTFTTAHGLAHDTVLALWVDPDGGVWAGTRGGLSYFDGQRFANRTTADGLSNNNVRALCADDDGTLWAGTDSGVTGFRGDRVMQVRSGREREYDQVRALVCGEDVLWIGSDAGLSRYDGESVEVVLDADLSDPFEAWAVLVDEEERVWVGSAFGVHRLDPTTGDVTHHGVTDGLAQNRVYRILEDDEGGLWFAGDGGLSRYDAKGFARLTVADGLLADQVEALHVTEEGDVWIGSDGGVQRLRGDSLVTMGATTALREVRSIVEDPQGNVWVGTTRGLSRWDGRDWRYYTVDDGLVHNWVQKLFVDRRGDLWAATWGGVSQLRPEGFRNITVEDGLLHKLVWDIVEDREGHLWFATEAGIDRYTRDGQFTHFTTEEGLSHRVARSLLVDSTGRLWAGTDFGLNVFDGSRWTSPEGATSGGVARNVVWAILEDDAGQIWIGTEGGVGRYDGRVMQSLLRRDGLVNNAVRTLARGPDGDVWIGTLGGVTRYRSRVSPPRVQVTQVVADRRYAPAEEIAIAAPRALVAFEFFGRSHKTRSDAMLYRYRLRGHDDHWRTTGQRRVEFRDLDRGEYTFEVTAIDRDLTYAGAPATVDFAVQLPRGWIVVWGLLVAVVGFSAWQARGIWQRNRRLRASHEDLRAANEALTAALEEKEVLIKEVHHRVKNNMQVISSLLNLRAGHSDDERVQELLRESQERIQAMSLVHEQLYQSPSLAAIEVRSYLRQLVDNARAYDAGHGNVQLDVLAEVQHQFDLETATSCGLIVNELVTNCLKHAFPDGRAGHVTVRYELDGEEAILTVRDDGVGMPQGADVDGTLGTQLIAALARQLQASMRVDGSQGTTVELRFPAPGPARG